MYCTCLGLTTAPTNFPSPAICNKLSVGNKIIFLELRDHPICLGHVNICHMASRAPSKSSKLAVILLLIIWKIPDFMTNVFHYTITLFLNDILMTSVIGTTDKPIAWWNMVSIIRYRVKILKSIKCNLKTLDWFLSIKIELSMYSPHSTFQRFDYCLTTWLDTKQIF